MIIDAKWSQSYKALLFSSVSLVFKISERNDFNAFVHFSFEGFFLIHRKKIKVLYSFFFKILYFFCLCSCVLCFTMRVLIFILSSFHLLSPC